MRHEVQAEGDKVEENEEEEVAEFCDNAKNSRRQLYGSVLYGMLLEYRAR